MSHTQIVKMLKGIIKNDAKDISLMKLNEIIFHVDGMIKETPDIDHRGYFMADRKILLSDILMKLNFIRMSKEDLEK